MLPRVIAGWGEARTMLYFVFVSDYCMVNFIKPSFLGSDKEFSNLYANPIKNGQCKDSDHQSIKIMKQRSYVLHNKLSKFVQVGFDRVFKNANNYIQILINPFFHFPK